MKDITKQSEETFIQWRIAGNPVMSDESASEAILTIHPDGRVTTSDRLKPTETAALVLDQIKTAWLKDAQATKIRELEAEIEEKRKDVVWLATEKAKLENYVTELENRLRALWDKYDGDRKHYMERIKRLEEFVDQLTNPKFTRDDLPKEALLQRIKRLEEAGNAVAAIIGPPGSAHWADENQVDAAWNNWRKAKEAKL